MSQITLDPYVPLALWVPLALAAAALTTVYAMAVGDRLAGWRRWAVPVLMAAAVAVPLVILLNPTWLRRAPPPPGKPLLTVLVDSSASMAVHDAEGGRSRYRQACAVAKAAAGGLADRYDVALRTFAADSSLTTPQALDAAGPDGAATDLAAVLDRALDDERPQGQAILLLSDGIDNAGGSSRFRQTMARAKALGAPVYTKTLGGPAEVRDLEVGLKRPQEVAFVRQPVPVSVTLRQQGALAASVSLRLLLEGKEVEKRTAKLLADGATEEVFHVVQDKAGLFRYEVRADVLPGEVSAANNVASLLLRVIDQPVRVLLLEGKPYWDTKFLIRTLSLDESVELTAVVQLAAGRLLQRNITRKAAPEAWTVEKDAAKFLADPAALASYQIVILGRGAEVFLSDEALVRLRKWLGDEDGSLVCFRGAPSSEINQRLDESAGPLDAVAGAAVPRPLERRRAVAGLAAGGRGGRPVGRHAVAGRRPGGRGEALRGDGAGHQRGRRAALRARGELPPGGRDGKRPGGGGRGLGHVALGLLAAAVSTARRAVRHALAKPGPLAGDQRGAVALAAPGAAGRQGRLHHRGDRVRHAVGPRDPLERRRAAAGSLRSGAGPAPGGRLPAVGDRAGTVPCRLGATARGPLPDSRGRRGQGRDLGRGGLGRPREPEGAAGSHGPAGPDEMDRPVQRRRVAGVGRPGHAGAAVRGAPVAQPARADHSRAGLGPLVGAGRRAGPLGDDLGLAPKVRTDIAATDETRMKHGWNEDKERRGSWI